MAADQPEVERAESKGEKRPVVKAPGKTHKLLFPVAAAACVLLVALLGSIGSFSIGSSSMFPTMEMGDTFFAWKLSYGIFRKAAPKRGDVVVFRFPDPNPAAEPLDFVKRVIALQGDHLELRQGAPFINGWPVPSCRVGSATQPVDSAGQGKGVEIYVEFLDGNAYLVAREPDGFYSSRVEGPWVVEAGELWVLGDNRDNSSDSRSWRGGRGGGLPLDNLHGKAGVVWAPAERTGIDVSGKPVLPTVFSNLEPELKRCLAAAPSLADTTPPAPSQ